MNAQRAYEYINKTHEPSDSVSFLKGLIEALTGEKEKVEKPVKVGDRVRFSQDGVSGVGEVCCVYVDGHIKVGLDAKIDGYGWTLPCGDGSDHAKKRGFNYGWYASKGNYTIIGRA